MMYIKRILTFITASLLLWGCDSLSDVPSVELSSGQPSVVTLDADGESVDIAFTSAMDWDAVLSYISSETGWADLDAYSGNGGKSASKVTLTARKNETMSKRSAKVTISSGTASMEVICIQEGQPEPVFRLVESSCEIGAEGGLIEVTVEANVDYECTVTADWIREVKSKTYDTDVHVFEVDANAVDGMRTTTLSFCGNQTCVPFTVTQFGTGSELYLTTDLESVSVEAEGTQTPITVNVDANVDWMVSSSAEWCTVNPASGLNDGSFTISVSETESYKSRICVLTLTSFNTDAVAEIVVSQASRPMEGSVDWVNSDFQHRSLFMRFTADWCGYCPMMATAVDIAQEQVPGKIEALSVHGGGSSLECSASVALLNDYGVSSFPTGYMDGYIKVGNYSDTNVTASKILAAAEKRAEDYGVYTGLSWTSEIKEGKVATDMTVYVKNPGTYYITVLLVEDGIIGYQNGMGRNYEHNGIIRAAFTHALGDKFSTSDECQAKNFSYAVKIPSACNVDNLKIVAYVSRTENYVDFIDNAASAKVGVSKELEVK